MIRIKDLEVPEMTAEEVRSEYILYQSSAETFRYQQAEDEEFYLGKQLTTAQKDFLISIGQPPEANNKIRPAVEQVLSNIASATPEWDVSPVGKTDNDVSVAFNALLDKVWYESRGDSQFRAACKDFIIKGQAFLYVYPDWAADDGLGAIRVKRLPPESIYCDPNSTQPDLSDASSIIVSDLFTKKHLKIAFPQHADIVDEAQEDYYKNEIATDKYSRDDVLRRADEPQDHQPKVRKFVRFSKVSVPKVQIIETVTGNNKILDKKEYKEFTKDPNYKVLVKEGMIEEKIIYETRVHEMCIIGDKVAYSEVLPIVEYPIAVALNEHAGTPFSSGDVRHAKTPQRMLNRTEALLISHTSSTANFKLVVEDGAIDPNELAKWAIPNAIVRANPGALRENKIKEFVPPAVSSQLYNEKGRYETDIETIFGAYKFQQGNPSGAPGTVGEAQIIDEASSRKQNWKILPIYDMLTHAGKSAVEWIPYVYDQQRSLRIVSPTGEESELMLNIPVVDDKSGMVKRMYDMVSSKVDIRVVIGSTRAKTPMAKLQKDISLLNAGIYDRTEVIMNLEGNIDKTSLLQRMSEIQNLRSQVEQLTEQLKSMQGDIQTRERELFHANMRAELANATKPVAQAVSNVKATSKLEQERQRDKTRKLADDVGSAISAINSDKGAPSA